MNRFWTFVAGAAMVGWGFYEAQHTLALKSGGAIAEGRVVAAKITDHGRRPWSSDSLAPVVEYATRDGKVHQFVSRLSGTSFGYGIGEKVTVLYDEAEPDRNSRIDSFLVNWGAPLVLIPFGGYALLWFFGIVKTKDGESPLRSRRSRWWDDD